MYSRVRDEFYFTGYDTTLGVGLSCVGINWYALHKSKDSPDILSAGSLKTSINTTGTIPGNIKDKAEDETSQHFSKLFSRKSDKKKKSWLKRELGIISLNSSWSDILLCYKFDKMNFCWSTNTNVMNHNFTNYFRQ